ncbi:uncharacterized protein LOC144548536 [Carex rostrata]
MSNESQAERWVWNVERMLQKVTFPDIPTKSLQASTDSEEKPSIFCEKENLPFVYFGEYNYPICGIRSDFSGWQFVGFMRRWFDLDLRSYNQYIQEKKHLARGYYHRDYFDNDTYLLEHLLINSCILVFAILLFQNVRNGIEILSGTKEINRDREDQRSKEFYILYQYIMKDPMKIKLQMLTMHYQTPWFVVERIYTNCSNLSNHVGTPIDKLALSCFDDLYPGMHKSKVHGDTSTLPPGGFKHLLHMFHWSRTPEENFLVETSSLFIRKMVDYYIPSVTELQLFGTVFEKHAGGSIDMSFYDRRLSGVGVMQLAPWHMLTDSSTLVTELLRFERQYVNCGFPFTAYFASMACMLKTEADVQVLRANGVIIPSTRFDDKDILCCVRELKSEIDDNIAMPNPLKSLEEKVMAHYQRSSYRVYGEFKRRYCSNPWITVSVIAGICLFFLNLIQTLLLLFK